MKLRRWLAVAALTLPFLLAVWLDWRIRAKNSVVNILDTQIRVDSGTLVLILGSSLSTFLLAAWVVRLWNKRRYERSLAVIHSEAAQLRKRFLSQLDHELKNPLTALRATIAYMADGVAVENYDRAISNLALQVDRLGRLVSDLRKLAEMEELAIDCMPVDMSDLLGEVLEAAQDHPGYKEREVVLNLGRDPKRLPLVSGDRGLLWLACYNLVDNALKFSPVGAKIEVRVYETNPWLVVEVLDDGLGISANELTHVFEDLYRGSNARGLPGSGLGLALVRSVVARHQGTVQARNRPGQGIVFTMRIPTAVSSRDTPQ